MQFAKGAFGSKFILTTSVSPAAVTSTLSTIDPQLIVTLSRTTVMLSSPTYFRAAGSARSITSITKVDVSSDSTAFETTFIALFVLWLHWALTLDVDWRGRDSLVPDSPLRSRMGIIFSSSKTRTCALRNESSFFTLNLITDWQRHLIAPLRSKKVFAWIVSPSTSKSKLSKTMPHVKVICTVYSMESASSCL